MADKVSYQKPSDADEFQVSKFKPGYQSFVDPDKGWQWGANKNYQHDDWYSTIDGSWEQRVAKESVVDGFTAFNVSKMPAKPGEYYSVDHAPKVIHEFDEEEYWKNAPVAKTDDQVAEELDAPRVALEEAWVKYIEKAPDAPRIPMVPIWTPAMAMMVAADMPARKLNFELAPFFQLNKLGYRKCFSNTRLCEMRPFFRFNELNANFIEDYLIRWQMQRTRLTTRPRFTVLKAYIFLSMGCAFLDQMWCHEFRKTRKWH